MSAKYVSSFDWISFGVMKMHESFGKKEIFNAFLKTKLMFSSDHNRVIKIWKLAKNEKANQTRE